MVASVPAKYRLVSLACTNQIASDDSYYSGYLDDDDQGITGFTVERNIRSMFAEVLREHLVMVGMSILPWCEQLHYAEAFLLSLRRCRGELTSSTASILPNFRTAVEHFCLPTAGRPHILRLGQ